VDRVERTLAGFEVVNKVDFNPVREQFEVEYRSECEMGEEFRAAVNDVIIFPSVRKFLGCVGDRLNNSVVEEP